MILTSSVHFYLFKFPTIKINYIYNFIIKLVSLKAIITSLSISLVKSEMMRQIIYNNGPGNITQNGKNM